MALPFSSGCRTTTAWSGATLVMKSPAIFLSGCRACPLSVV